MSYCRWSSDNFMCDAYVYEDVNGGYTTHIAENRLIIRPFPDIGMCSLSMILMKWSGSYFDKTTRSVVYPYKAKKLVCKLWFLITSLFRKMHYFSLSIIPRRDIGLPFDGQTFNDETASDCADRLEIFKKLGYKIPQYAIDDLRREED